MGKAEGMVLRWDWQIWSFLLPVSGGDVPWGSPPVMPQRQGTLQGCSEVGSEDGFSSGAIR